MFMEITITVDLSDAMDKAMPKRGPEELAAIDAHSDTIHDLTENAVASMVEALGNAGYLASA